MKDAIFLYSLVCFVSVAGLPQFRLKQDTVHKVAQITDQNTLIQETQENIVLPPEDAPIPSSSKSNLNNLPNIIGGENSAKGEFPWQCSLKLEVKYGLTFHICGAVIYDPTTILTAAHCVEGQNVSALLVVCGEHNFLAVEGTEQYRRAVSFVIHPDRNQGRKEADFAYLTLVEPLKINDDVKAIQLADQDFQTTGKCINTGWGKVRGDGSGSSAAILQKVYLDLVPQENCRQRYSEFISITSSMVCGGYVNPEEAGDDKGACSGDSGGPFVCPGEFGVYELVGVVSFGSDPCAMVQYPTVFASIPHLGSWVRQSIKAAEIN